MCQQSERRSNITEQEQKECATKNVVENAEDGPRLVMRKPFLMSDVFPVYEEFEIHVHYEYCLCPKLVGVQVHSSAKVVTP